MIGLWIEALWIEAVAELNIRVLLSLASCRRPEIRGSLGFGLYEPGGCVARRKMPEQREKRNKEAADTMRAEGVVEEALPNTTFRVKLDTGHDILAYISGKMRIHYIRILPGDRVVLEISPYDTSRGRIVYRK